MFQGLPDEVIDWVREDLIHELGAQAVHNATWNDFVVHQGEQIVAAADETDFGLSFLIRRNNTAA